MMNEVCSIQRNSCIRSDDSNGNGNSTSVTPHHPEIIHFEGTRYADSDEKEISSHHSPVVKKKKTKINLNNLDNDRSVVQVLTPHPARASKK